MFVCQDPLRAPCTSDREMPKSGIGGRISIEPVNVYRFTWNIRIDSVPKGAARGGLMYPPRAGCLFFAFPFSEEAERAIL